MNLQRKFFEITCLSPVHVGNGETLKSFEYLHDRKHGAVYFVDEAKWISFLYANGLTDDFFAYVQKVSAKKFVRENVWDWLNSHGVDAAQIVKLAAHRADAKVDATQKLSDIDRHIALTDGQPYIPGSALKGLFRTAILHAQIKNSPELRRRYWQQVSATASLSLKRRNNECGKICRALENEIFAKLDYRAAEKFKRVPDQFKSVLRGLKVSDAACTQAVDTVILQRTDATTKLNSHGELEKILPLFYECIPANTKLRFSMTLDFDMLTVKGISAFDDIFRMAREFMLFAVERLEEVFGQRFPQQFAQARTADALIGGGTGFLSKSLLYSLAPSHEAAKNWAADYFDEAFTVWNFAERRREPAHWHEVFDEKISPRTLKLRPAPSGEVIAGLVQFREPSTC